MKRRMATNNTVDLFLSVANGTLEGLRNYLQHGGSPDLQDRSSGLSLLHMAVTDNNTEKIKVLLEKGCCVNIKDDEDRSSMHVAADQSHHAALDLLLEAGANVNDACAHHTTPLMAAALKGDKHAVEHIITKAKFCDVNAKNFISETPLTEAVCSGNIEICDVLLRHGAKLNYFQNTTLKIPVLKSICSNLTLMKLFLKHKSTAGIDIHRCLMLACMLKQVNVAAVILGDLENPFNLRELGLVKLHEDFEVLETLAKPLVKSYKYATKCSKDNHLLMLIFNFCEFKFTYDQYSRVSQREKATAMIRVLVDYGLVIHPQTSVLSCTYECSCRKCIFTALYNRTDVPTLRAQSCSVIRQNLPGKVFFDEGSVQELPLPGILKQFICMHDW